MQTMHNILPQITWNVQAQGVTRHGPCKTLLPLCNSCVLPIYSLQPQWECRMATLFSQSDCHLRQLSQRERKLPHPSPHPSETLSQYLMISHWLKEFLSLHWGWSLIDWFIAPYPWRQNSGKGKNIIYTGLDQKLAKLAGPSNNSGTFENVYVWTTSHMGERLESRGGEVKKCFRWTADSHIRKRKKKKKKTPVGDKLRNPPGVTPMG